MPSMGDTGLETTEFEKTCVTANFNGLLEQQRGDEKALREQRRKPRHICLDCPDEIEQGRRDHGYERCYACATKRPGIPVTLSRMRQQYSPPTRRHR